MYLSYYGMKCNPFDKSISTKDAFKSEDFNNSISRLEYLKEVKGLGLIIGSPGLGKTFMLRYFNESLNKDLYKVIYISPTSLSLFDFYKTIGRELNVDVGNCFKADLYDKIQKAIMRMVDEQRVSPIFIIDDAHNLSREILEEFKVLFDFEMDSMNYTTVILVAHPTLKVELAKDIYESLKQRLIVNYKFNGLDREEVKEYVKSRLEISGVTPEIFTPDALNALYSCSKSSPRRLNSLVVSSLMIGSQKKSLKIDSEIVMLAKGEIDIE